MINGTCSDGIASGPHDGCRARRTASPPDLRERVASLEDANRVLVDEAQLASEHAHLRLSEVEHRLMNTFSTIQALVAQTARPDDSGAAFRAVFGARLLALARSHELLGSRFPRGAPLGLVVERCLEPFETPLGRIAMSGPCVHLRARDVLPIGLALHELTTNAAKYGALSVPEGRVEVAWREQASEADGGSVVITWRERGGPAVVPPTRRGFGSRLIERGLSQSCGGTAELDFAPSGLGCRIRLPLATP